ncbi:NADPH azoreductase [Arcanobacterium haemolyticum]|uniref:NADPH-dependent FMN reductase n=1 Tax=Arcanobacterium haemolyticum TaxID=28264 RepID=UPI000D99641F|nr:NAD(P)H-dependent oxidoreductase [Arcanobacterium haemolyticum]SPT74347.1 NADPH azoreductase [Arcanobacterium haemolyticum]
MTKIGIFVGSRRNGSWNQKVADDLTTLLPETFETCQIEIHNLPFYESEWDQPETLPEPVRIARKIAEECDGFIFITPEYNRSIPAVIKNALDILSRPYGSTRFTGKPTLIATATPGAMGGFGANRDLRTVLSFLDAHLIQQPEIHLSFVHQLYDAHGQLNSATQEFLEGAVAKFSAAFAR